MFITFQVDWWLQAKTKQTVQEGNEIMLTQLEPLEIPLNTNQAPLHHQVYMYYFWIRMNLQLERVQIKSPTLLMLWIATNTQWIAAISQSWWIRSSCTHYCSHDISVTSNQFVWELHWPYTLSKPRPILCANYDLLMLLDIPLNGVMTEELPSAKITCIIICMQMFQCKDLCTYQIK